MPQIINTNILAINAQRQLNKSQTSQATSIERLSSGLRINSAKDDAAGLAISTRFETQVRGLNQAVRNANDGISLAQTAEGSLSEMGNILQRMRELAVQSSNDTNSDQDRLSIQAEVDQLYGEIERISETTEFNGVKLLDGTAGTRTFQIGANAGQTVDFSVDAVTTKALNLNGFSALGELNGGRVTGTASAANEVAINGVDIAASGATAITAKDAINLTTGSHGVTATAYNTVEGSGAVTGITTGALTINGDTVTASGSLDELVTNINRDVAGITATIGKEGGIVLSNDTGADIVVGGTVTNSGLTAETYKGFVSLTSTDGKAIEITKGSDAGATAADIQAFGFNESTGSNVVKSGAVLGTAVTTTDGITINGEKLGAIGPTGGTNVSAADVASAVNAISAKTGVEASATTVVETGVELAAFSTALAGTTMKINGTTIAGAAVTSMDQVVERINAAGVQGVIASTDAESGNLVLTSSSGLNIRIEQGAAGQEFTDVAGTDVTTRGTLTIEGSNGQDVTIDSTATTEANKATALAKLGLTDQGGSSTAVGAGLSVTTRANAAVAIDRIDEALDKVSSARANLGAFQNRMGSTISNLENVSQNLSAANSRIRDADFAVETANLTKTQILQQAGVAMLSQANASTQNVLSLLG